MLYALNGCVSTLAKTKCEQYWPSSEVPIKIGGFTIRLLSEKKEKDWTLRDLSIKNQVLLVRSILDERIPNIAPTTGGLHADKAVHRLYRTSIHNKRSIRSYAYILKPCVDRALC